MLITTKIDLGVKQSSSCSLILYVILCIYDKVSNMMDGIWMRSERRQRHQTHLRKLCEDVERNYGELNITKLARTLF